MRYVYLCQQIARTPAGNVVTLAPADHEDTPSHTPAIQVIVPDGHRFEQGKTYTITVQ